MCLLANYIFPEILILFLFLLHFSFLYILIINIWLLYVLKIVYLVPYFLSLAIRSLKIQKNKNLAKYVKCFLYGFQNLQFYWENLFYFKIIKIFLLFTKCAIFKNDYFCLSTYLKYTFGYAHVYIRFNFIFSN